MQHSQPDDGPRHAGLRPGPLICELGREVSRAPVPCTNATEWGPRTSRVSTLTQVGLKPDALILRVLVLPYLFD